MQNTSAAFHIQTQKAGSARYIGAGLVAVVHLVIIYALVTGLAQRIVIQAVPELTAQVIAPAPERPQTAPLPPLPSTLPVPHEDAVPPPRIMIQAPAAPQAVTALPSQPAAASAPADSAASAITDTHTTPPYPGLARRLGLQGTVILQLTIGTDGHVDAATVAASSGSPELDQAAADWVTAHWRYQPAIQNGVAVISTTTAAVKFDLASPN